MMASFKGRRGSAGGREGDRRGGRGGQHGGGGDYYRSHDSRYSESDGRTQGRGDSNNNLAKNVRQLCETPIDRSLKIRRFQKGREGTPLELIANQFCLVIGISVCFRYDVEIRLAEEVANDRSKSGKVFREKKMRRLALKENKDIIEKLAKEWTDVFGNKKFVFDGQKCILTVEKLAINDGQTVSRNVCIEFDGYREQMYEVFIQFTNEVNMNSLNDLYDGRLVNAKYDDFQPVLQVLEIVLRYMPSQTRIPVGKSLYSKKNHRDIGDNAVMAFGHYQAVNITEVGPTIVVDRSATLFRKSGPLLEFIANIIRSNDLTQILNDRRLKASVDRQISGLKIATKHVRNSLRIDTSDALSQEIANTCKFLRDKKDGSGEEEITVRDYFEEAYNLTLSFGHFPLLLLKGGSNRMLPIEVCNVCPEQPVPKRQITPNMTREIVRNSNSQKPIERFGFIQESLETIAHESRDLLNAFRLQVIEKPIKINGRKLIPPQLEGNDRRVRESMQLTDWLFINLSPKVADQMQRAKQFVDEMISTGDNMGITITPIGPKYVKNGKCNDSETCKKIYTMAMSVCPKVQLIVFCISSDCNPDDRDFDDESDDEQEDNQSKDKIYNMIKYYGDCEFGVITQCINADRVLDIKKGYFNNLLLKINSKLNGKNVILKTRLTVMAKPVMFVGVDVTHPGSNPSGNDSRIISSVAAVVGSYDKDFIKYRASVRVQPHNRQEIVQQFDQMMTELLQHFRSVNKVLPESIVVFRDGVSEGQFSQVMDEEFRLLLNACHKLTPNYKPKVTVIVVAKRHQTRLIKFTEEIERGRAVPNIPPGTVVDNTIVNPIHREFYLCSHKGMLGTSRPTKYVVLRDDNNMTADEIQKLCYYLCFISNRTTKCISMPSPVNNAHLAAFRAKVHILAKNTRIEGMTRSRNESKEEREEHEALLAEELNRDVIVNELVKNKLYYC